MSDYGNFSPDAEFTIEPRHEWTEDGPGRLLGWDILHTSWATDYWGEAGTGTVAFIEVDGASNETERQWIVDALNAHALLEERESEIAQLRAKADAYDTLRAHLGSGASAKQRYTSLQLAEIQARYMTDEQGEPYEAYPCPHCDGDFHVGPARDHSIGW
jgi:hypothetical protein